MLSSVSVITMRTLCSPVFPYTTLFRSSLCRAFAAEYIPRPHYCIPTRRLCTRLRGWCYSCGPRSEEHTSELQSRGHLVCRLLLERKSQDHPEEGARYI